MAKIPNTDLLDDIQQVANIVGETPTIREYEDNGKYSSSTIIKRFETWSNAVDTAELEPNSKNSVEVSEEELLNDVQRVADKIDATPSRRVYDDHGKYSASTLTRRFGDWSSAVTTAGYEPLTGPAPEYSEEELLEDIQRVGKVVDGTPSENEYSEHGYYTTSTVTRRFENWNNAVTGAGYEPNTKPTHSNDFVKTDEALSDLLKVRSELGKPPSKAEYNDLGTYSAQTIIRRVGGWNKALDQLGLEINQRWKISDEELLSELSEVTEKLGRPPSIEEYKQRGKIHPDTFINRFGGWRDAIKEAGHEPTYRKSNLISKEDLITELQQIADDLGETPTKRQYHNHSDTEYHPTTQVNRFGAWKEAVEAAGLEPKSQSRHANGIPKEDLLLSIRDLANDLGHTPTTSEYHKYGKHSLSTILSRFKTYSEATDEADLSPTDWKISEESILEDIRAVADEIGRPPKRSEYKKLGEYSSSTVSDRFGGWNGGVQAAGLVPSHQGKIEDPTELLKDIASVSDGGIGPNKFEYENQGKFSTGTVADHFGNFWRAVVCAGCRPKYRNPLTPAAFDQYYHAVVDTNITQKLSPLLLMFTGLSPSLLKQFTSTWIQNKRKGLIVRIPPEYLADDLPWIFRLPEESPR